MIRRNNNIWGGTINTSANAAYPVPKKLEAALRRVFHDGCRREDAETLARDLVRLFDCEGPWSSRAKKLLVESGVQEQWNQALGTDRPRVVSVKLLPLLRGRVADVLSGDGTLTRALSSHDGEIVAFERVGAYPTQPVYPTRPFHEFANVAPGEFDTLLVSTVLHHEEDLEGLLSQLVQAKAKRWVVVENCITPQAPVDLHEFVDIIFNNTLNDFDVACPTQHRTIVEWTEILSQFGTVRLHAQLDSIPGIPFSYEVFAVEVQ